MGSAPTLNFRYRCSGELQAGAQNQLGGLDLAFLFAITAARLHGIFRSSGPPAEKAVTSQYQLSNIHAVHLTEPDA